MNLSTRAVVELAAVATVLCAAGAAVTPASAAPRTEALRCVRTTAPAGVHPAPLSCVIDRAAVKSRKLNTNRPVPFGATR